MTKASNEGGGVKMQTAEAKNSEQSIEIVWGAVTPELREEVISLWLAENALPNREACEARVGELVAVGRDPDGRVAAISTAYRRFNAMLDCTLLYMRFFVAEHARQSGIGLSALTAVVAFFDAKYEAGEETLAAGMFLVIENEMLMRVRNQGLWPETRFVYVGKNDAGHHLRVHFFDGARVGCG
jgi:hypothetical protein